MKRLELYLEKISKKRHRLAGSVHGLGFITHAIICPSPRRNPKPRPLSTRKSNSTRPTYSKFVEFVG